MEKQLRFPLEIQFFAEGPNPNGNEQIDENQVDDTGTDQTANQGNGDGNNSAEEGTTPPAGQSRADNTRYAEMRRKAEKAAKEKAEKENQERERLQQESFDQGRINALGGINPYTKKPIKTKYDLALYDVMKELDDQGIAPTLESVSEAMSKKENARLEAEQQTARQEQERAALADKQLKELKEKFPEFDEKWLIDTLNSNTKFNSLVSHGFSPLEACEMLDIKPAAKAPTPPRQSTPSSTPSGEQPPKKSVRDMTADEYEEYAIAHHGAL